MRRSYLLFSFLGAFQRSVAKVFFNVQVELFAVTVIVNITLLGNYVCFFLFSFFCFYGFEFCDDFSTFFTNNLLTIASFRVGVPSILFLVISGYGNTGSEEFMGGTHEYVLITRTQRILFYFANPQCSVGASERQKN